MKSYGITKSSNISSKDDEIIEELRLNGYSIIENYLNKEECEELTLKLEKVYTEQENSFGKENLIEIQELNTCRMPFLYDVYFAGILSDSWVVDLFEGYIDGKLILHLQNGIINRPKKEHHQTSWHRDLPYQNYITSEPIGLNAFYCLTDFNKGNGGTILLPYSHKIESFPSNSYVEKHAIQLDVPAGSLLLFDSFVYHKAGNNTSEEVRYGLNHLYVRPLLKQQVDICRVIEDWSKFTIKQQEILGRNFAVPKNVDDFRKIRQNRKK